MLLYNEYEGLGLPLYIIGLNSYEVLYNNEESKKIFGDMVGRKCHEVLHGKGNPCEACVSPCQLEENARCCAKARYLAAVGKYVDTYESVILLPDGSKARLCLVVDITEKEQIQMENEAKEKTRKDMQHLIDIQSGFIGSAKSMMSAATLSGDMIFANHTMSETLGFSQEEILHMSIPDFHPPEIARDFVEKYNPQALAEGMWKGDTLVLRKDGSCLPVRQTVFPVRNEAGEIIATAAIMDDITDVLKLERMNRYQIAIMDCSTNYIGVSDLDGNTVYHSPGAYRMLGYEPGETEEWDKRVSHPDWYLERIFTEGIPTAMKAGQWIGRGELINRYGECIPIEQTIFPVFDEEHQIMGTATIIQDITDAVEQEKELEAGRRMLRTIIDTVPSAIFWKDRNSCFLGSNKQFAIDAGFDDPDKLISMTDYDIYPKEIAELYTSFDRKIFETGEELLHIEEPFQGNDGETRWISTSKALIRDGDGKPYALLGIYDDITKLKQNEKKLEEAMEAAEEASRAKSDFLSHMSHEIRTPMNAIKGLAELLALTELSDIQDGYIRNIVKSSNSLLSIINDVLDFSKINENKIELIETNYLLADFITEVSSMVNLRATEKGLDLLMEISPSLPKELIGDDVRVKQVIINILNNAVKYTQKGHVIVRLFGEQTGKDFELVCTVEDTGIGIRKEDIPFLFEAFSQADRRVNHHIQGTGLGLTISDKLIRGMGGSITVESEYGKGSIFTARFPQRVERYEPIATVEKPEEKRVLLLERGMRFHSAARMLDELGVVYTSAETPASIPESDYTHCIYDGGFAESDIRLVREKVSDCVFIALEDMRYAMGQSEFHDNILFLPLLITELVKVLALIPGQHDNGISGEKAIDNFVLRDTQVLVVDDNDINLIVGGEILRAYKADVTCAESGKIALEYCAETKFDLIFMDHMMPEMDGVATTIAIRDGNTPNKSTPIIALTANVVNDMASYYLENGMNDFIGKPIELDDLSRVLHRWLPASKITEIGMTLRTESVSPGQTRESSMERLIKSLDTFGMYVSDVMREIGNDYDLYFRRMDRVHSELTPLVIRLRDEVQAERWDDFAEDIDGMGSMIHDVGARDCAAQAYKLANAAIERNTEYIRNNFFKLMDNMYMLGKKMEVAVPLVLGTISQDVPFGDLGYCYNRLLDMKTSLSAEDYETSAALLDSLAHYSLDHALDLILVELGTKLSAHDFYSASILREQALNHCESILK